MNKTFARSAFIWTMFAAVAGVALLWAAVPGTSTPEPALPAGAGITSWHDNGVHGRYVVEMIDGKLPISQARDLHGTVMSDADCTPDARGLNHCHNVIALDGAVRVTVINHHQMSRHHCLRPGEPVRIAPLAGQWAIVQTLD